VARALVLVGDDPGTVLAYCLMQGSGRWHGACNALFLHGLVGVRAQRLGGGLMEASWNVRK
jgi:hypothetical protein